MNLFYNIIESLIPEIKDPELAQKEFDLGFFNGIKKYNPNEPPTSRIRAIGAILGLWWRVTRDLGILEYIVITFKKLNIPIGDKDLKDIYFTDMS